MTAHLALMVLCLPLIAAVLLRPQVYNVTWSPKVISSRIVLDVYNGDTLRFICPDGVFSRVEEQTRIQVDSCNKSADPASTVQRENVGNCLGSQKVFFVELQNPSDRLPGVSAYPPGFSYYFTSYTPQNASLNTVFDTSITSGGFCSRGMQIQINVLKLCDPGFYASAVLESCVRCPNNSNSTQSGLSECPCDEGYYRTPQEVDLPCTQSPSPPCNVRVVNSTSTSVTLAWEEPLSTGGRNRSELRYNLWYRVAGGFSATLRLHVTVFTTVGEIQGLVSGVVYQLFVSAETDITCQIPDGDFENRSVAISYRLPNNDSTTESPNTDSVTESVELIIGVTVSTGVAIVAVIVITVALCIAVLCYKKKVKKIERTESVEPQAVISPQPLLSKPSYVPISPLQNMISEGAYDNYEKVDNLCEQGKVQNWTQKLEKMREDLAPNVAYGPLVESGTTSPPQLQLNPSYGPVCSAQQQADNTGDTYDYLT